MRIRCGIVLAVLVVVCRAAPARAQWVVSPYLGINLGGDAEFRRGAPADPPDISEVGWGSSLMSSVTTIIFKDRNVELVPNNCAPGVVAISCIDLNVHTAPPGSV